MPMRAQYLSPALSGALTATKREALRAQAIHEALISEVAPAGTRLVEKPDGSWMVIYPDPSREEAPDA
jgi:hypothetical protein